MKLANGIVFLAACVFCLSLSADESFFKYMKPGYAPELGTLSIDPTSASTLAGFETADSAATNYYPQVNGYTGGNCTTELASPIYNGGLINFSSSQVKPSTWYLFIPSTSSIYAPNLITWVDEASTFLVSDSETDGADGGGTTNGQVYSNAPTFDSTDGHVSGASFGSGTLIIRGNSTSGSSETPSTTAISNGTLSNNSSQYVFKTSSLAYAYRSDTGYISWRTDSGDSVGGD